MSRTVTIARTLLAIGVRNVARVMVYRLGLRTRLAAVCRLREALPRGPFFRPVAQRPSPAPPTSWGSEASYFGWFKVALGDGAPDWFANPLGGGRFTDSSRPWFRIPDFDTVVGDIKGVWEASRFDWLLSMAQRAVGGSPAEVERMNAWLADWAKNNPAYYGPNWKCGQEASIRVIHLATATLISGQVEDPEPGLLALIRVHLRRIVPTLGYAIAQDNNHGTSEAAAMFIGGSWLQLAAADREGERWAHIGRRLLEERVGRLVGEDGGFSQYSVVYHRVLLDTLSIVTVWRRHWHLEEFSECFRARAVAAAHWLRAFTDPATGDAPNMGANDGARLLPLTDTDFRDFRPSVQLGCVLLAGARSYEAHGPWDEPLAWLGGACTEAVLAEEPSRLFDSSGYAVLRRGEAVVFLRYPRFRFRPSHADVLHVDLWIAGVNLLRDSGSYSYNSEPRWSGYFPETVAHNTIEFDGRGQMPRLGRFLFGEWLKTEHRSEIFASGAAVGFTASYRDRLGARHERTIVMTEKSLRIEDRVEGFRDVAVVRWRLSPGRWRLENSGVVGDGCRLSIKANMELQRVELVEGWESRYYFQRESLPVLEIEIGEAGSVVTEIEWR
jgi:hypothetical protein